MHDYILSFLISLSVFDIPKEPDQYLIQACSRECCISLKVERKQLERDLILDTIAKEIKDRLERDNKCSLD